MTTTTEEFVKHFHNLSGVTIGEKRKNLFHLINSYKSKSKELDFSLLQPTNFLEEKFKVDVLLHFKRTPDLIEVIKSEKPVLIRRVLTEWFLQEVVCQMSADELVSNIFPYVAFSTKVKIINKLAVYLNESSAADEFFKAIDGRYGSYLAAKLLPACHIDFIINFLKSHHANLTSAQLLTVIKRYPYQTEDVIEAVLQKTPGAATEQYENVFVYVGRLDVNLFVKLQQKHCVSRRLGWRVTGKYVRLHKDEVIASPSGFYRVLHNRQIAKTLHRNFAPLFFNMFPSTLDEFDRGYYTLFSLLQQLPRRTNRVDLLMSTFQKRYGKSIWDYATYVADLLDLLTPEQRGKYVVTRPESITEEKWNCYLAADTAVPYFKKQISLSSNVRTRARLIKCLVACCKFNMDLTALLGVCDYVVGTHRNDAARVREEFLDSLAQSFKLETLTEAHWRSINELLEMFATNGESFAQMRVFNEAYIHHRLLCRLPINEQLTQWVQAEHTQLNIIRQNSQFEKRCLLSFAAIINDKPTPDTRCLALTSALIDWNKRNEQDKITIFKLERVIKALKQIFSDGSAHHADFNILNYCIRENKKQRQLYLDLYLSASQQRYGNLTILDWLIRNDPSIVAHNIDRITRVLIAEYRCNRSFFAYTRNLSHLDVPQKIARIYLHEFQKDPNPDTIPPLCDLLPPEQFLQIIQPYYPSNLQADPKTSEGCRLYALQEVIADSLRTIVPPSAALEAILIFCKGDYLKLIRRGLYSVSDNVNEDKLVTFFAELLDRAVSTRKHAMHLTFRVLDKAHVCSVIKHFMEKEKNASLRKFIFKGCFNYFVTNPADFTWELLRLNLNAVDITDTEAVEILLQIDKVPADYMIQYVLLTWDVLNKVPDPDGKRTSDKAKLLRSISSELIPTIPADFIDAVVAAYFFKEDDLSHFGSTVNSFVCNSILYCNNGQEQEQRLNAAFAIVKDFIAQSWSNAVRRTSSRNAAVDFLKEFCLPFLTKKCSDREIFLKFMNLWNNFLKPHEAFDEYLHLTFTYFLLDSYRVDELPGKVEKLCDSLVEAYDQVVIGWLCNKFNFFIRYFFTGNLEVERFTFIEKFVHEKSSVACLLLAVLLLGGNNPGVVVKQRYKTIIAKLEKVSEPVVQLYLSSHFGGNQKLCYKVE